MLQMIIKWHQDRFISLRTISLKPALYDSYKEFVLRRLQKRDKDFHFDHDTRLTLYDVDIVRGSVLQKDDYYIERYRMAKDLGAYFGPNHKTPDMKIKR